MITPAYVTSMARYGAWQNSQLIGACAALPEAELRADRGAFFGSLFATMNHVLWADRSWMNRFAPDLVEAPDVPADQHGEITPDFTAWRRAREAMDTQIIAWAAGVTEARLAGELSWHSNLLQRDFAKPFGLCVVHFFNHQTHHRGQMHQMLSSLGADTAVSDLIFLPEDE